MASRQRSVIKAVAAANASFLYPTMRFGRVLHFESIEKPYEGSQFEWSEAIVEVLE